MKVKKTILTFSEKKRIAAIMACVNIIISVMAGYLLFFVEIVQEQYAFSPDEQERYLHDTRIFWLVTIGVIFYLSSPS